MRIITSILLGLSSWSALVAAEPATPRAAVAALDFAGLQTVTPEDIRAALLQVGAIRRLARAGSTDNALAERAAPMIVLGLKASGFAAARATVVGSRVVIEEGPQRVWQELEVQGPTPATSRLGDDLVRRWVARDTGLPSQEETRDVAEKPIWQSGSSARFDPGFRTKIKEAIEKGWTASGRTTPVVEVSVESLDSGHARCLVQIGEPPCPSIRDITVKGAVANGVPAILAWLDRSAGIRPGSPQDDHLVDAACARLLATGRFVQVSGTSGDDGNVTITVVEHPMLPALDAKLSPWQERWLDLGRQMERHVSTGAGIRIRVSGAPVAMAATLSRKHGISVSLGSSDQALDCTLSSWDGIVEMTRSGLPPLAWRSNGNGLIGRIEFNPTAEPNRTMGIATSLAFSTTRPQSMEWTFSPAAMLGQSAGNWAEVPGRSGVWQMKDSQGKESFQVTWDSHDVWQSWDTSSTGMAIHLTPAEAHPVVTPRPGSGLALWQEVLREPGRWFSRYSDQPWADLPVGLAAVIGRPAATLWRAEDAGRVEAIPFSIPEDPAWALPDQRPEWATPAFMAGYLSDLLGSTVGSETWPIWLADACSSRYEMDKEGFAAIQRRLERPGVLGPFGRLAEALLLHLGALPGAEDAARRGLTLCTAQAAWADLIAAFGTEDRLLDWIMAIDRPGDALRLVPPAQRPILGAAFTAIQAAPEVERGKLLAEAFRRWWDADLGRLVRQQLERLSGQVSVDSPFRSP